MERKLKILYKRSKEELDIDIKIIKKSKNVYENLPDKNAGFIVLMFHLMGNS